MRAEKSNQRSWILNGNKNKKRDLNSKETYHHRISLFFHENPNKQIVKKSISQVNSIAGREKKEFTFVAGNQLTFNVAVSIREQEDLLTPVFS